MIKTVSRFKSKLLNVAVYWVEWPFGPFPLLNHGESAFNLQLKLRCLAREQVCSDRYETAAAQAYYDAVGRHRARKLRKLRAPNYIISAESDLKRIESQLSTISFMNEPAYLLDNMVEAWLITVAPNSAEADAFDTQHNGEDLPNAN